MTQLGKCRAGFGFDAYLAQQGVQGVLQLHGNALQGLAGALGAQQLQGDGLVLAIDLAGRQLR